MKLNFSSHDVQVMTNELREIGIKGSWLSKVYDLSNKSIVLKFDLDKEKAEKMGYTKKFFLVLNSGQNFYPISGFKSEKAGMPSGFAMKLRKELENFRVEDIKQLSYDRVMQINFGKKEKKYYLILEMYGAGNIILLNSDDKIIALLHPFHYDEESKVRVGYIYPRNKALTDIDKFNPNSVEVMNDLMEKQKTLIKKTKLKMFLSRTMLGVYTPVLIEHVMTKKGIKFNQKVGKDTNFIELLNGKLEEIIEELEKIRNSKPNLDKGYIYGDNFYPTKYSFVKDEYQECTNFMKTVEHFFEKKKEQKEVRKVEKKKTEEDKTTTRIEAQITQLDTKKKETEESIDRLVDKIDWINQELNIIKKMVNLGIKKVDSIMEKSKLDIEKLEIHKRLVTFKINDDLYTFNFNKSAHANMSDFFQKKKLLNYKIGRTMEAKERISKEQTKNKQKEKLINLDNWKDKVNWFEKYAWFITKEGYIFVVGKTADQNEELVSKYLEKNDLYFHSSVAGSGSGILKKNTEELLSPGTLEECGSFLICHTKAWLAKTPDKAYWVYPNQVSKTPESGEYVTKGSFIIRGIKNFLGLADMTLGLTIIAKHDGDDKYDFALDDKIVHAIPMVAPYKTITNVKNKVKIIPGTMKTGKAVKSIVIPNLTKKNPLVKSILKRISLDNFNKVMVNQIKVI